ncbi:unnamed protein product, partial [Amoebophrya sp. A120]
EEQDAETTRDIVRGFFHVSNFACEDDAETTALQDSREDGRGDHEQDPDAQVLCSEQQGGLQLLPSAGPGSFPSSRTRPPLQDTPPQLLLSSIQRYSAGAAQP